MDISTNSLFAQMQNMSLDAMGSNSIGNNLSNNIGNGNAVGKVSNSGSDFGDILKGALESVNELGQDSGAKKAAFQMGDRSVTLAETMIAGQKAGIALDATVQIRNKFVEAYKEILNMPV
jgi:flagellar hook-basal body complex protein FliE